MFVSCPAKEFYRHRIHRSLKLFANGTDHSQTHSLFQRRAFLVGQAIGADVVGPKGDGFHKVGLPVGGCLVRGAKDKVKGNIQIRRFHKGNGFADGVGIMRTIKVFEGSFGKGLRPKADARPTGLGQQFYLFRGKRFRVGLNGHLGTQLNRQGMV